ncbi:MAG: EFR1 family ferrodoxin [Bacteroidales bacterium]|nr:EFR1 family ferrodoxin [Candidatus Cryptobacteroides onthequi]
MIFWYSGCGNSRFVAEAIAKGISDEMTFIPECDADNYEIGEGESIGFVFPVYAWGAPKLVEDFVKRVKWQGKAAYVWFACTCGDEMGHTHRDFKAVLAQKGLELEGTFCFQMPETYLAMPGFHLDTPEGAECKIFAAKAKLPQVTEQILAHAKVVDEIVGPFAGLKSGLIRKGFNANMSDRKYRAGEGCIGCGTCENVCPLGNVRLVDGRPQWQGHCTQCMACYHHCPTNAIQIGSYTAGKGQYYFRDEYKTT